MKIGVLLSGSGVYDGSEIHESVFSLLAIAEHGAEVLFIAPNVNQMHVVNHLSGEEMQETRNVLIESARIARGDIEDLVNISVNDFDALVIPGGFGTAKNHTTWAVNGPVGGINEEVRALIQNCIREKKPIAALCMAPTTIAKALEGESFHPKLTIGTIYEKSPYDIKAISDGVVTTGAEHVFCKVNEICIDDNLMIVSAPCYMMEASVLEVRNNVKQAIDQLFRFLP